MKKLYFLAYQQCKPVGRKQMTFILAKSDEKNLITVTYEINTSYQDRVDLLHILVKILESQPTINVLINTAGAKTNMTSKEQLEYGELLAENFRHFQHNKTAIVKENLNPHPYILAGAFGGGFRRIVEFDNLNEAIAWLNGEIK
jgi:hypothetical protein